MTHATPAYLTYHGRVIEMPRSAGDISACVRALPDAVVEELALGAVDSGCRLCRTFFDRLGDEPTWPEDAVMLHAFHNLADFKNQTLAGNPLWTVLMGTRCLLIYEIAGNVWLLDRREPLEVAHDVC